MIPRSEISSIDISDDWDTILDVLRTTPHTRLPVCEDNLDNIIGILHMKKVAHALAHGDLSRERCCDLAREREAYFVPEGTTLDVQLQNFQRDRRRIALVVDEYGDIRGLVTLEDILEEIVGEFTSDPGTLHKDIHRETDGSYVVNGAINVRVLNRTLGWNLPTDGPRTLNGLILEYLENIPEPGTSLKLGDLSIEILQAADNAVKTRASGRVGEANTAEHARRARMNVPSSAKLSHRALIPNMQNACVAHRPSRSTPITSRPSIGATRLVRLRNDRALEAVLRRFAQSLFAIRHRAHFARQPEFTETHELCRQRLIANARHRRQHRRQIDAPVSEMRTPPTTLTKTSRPALDTPPCRCNTASSNASRFDSRPTATRRGFMPCASSVSACTSIEHRPTAFARHHDRAAGDRLRMMRQKYRRRILHFLQTLLGHREHAHFVRRTETILDGADQAKAAAGIAFEIQHGIDHVLEDARPRDHAFLGHVTDDQHGDAGGLGESHERRRSFAHLRRRSRRRLDLGDVHRLDRIDDQHARTASLRLLDDRLDARFQPATAALSPTMPRRRARRLTCRSDSSPVT